MGVVEDKRYMLRVLEEAGFEFEEYSFLVDDYSIVFKGKARKIGNIGLALKYLDDVEVDGNMVKAWLVIP